MLLDVREEFVDFCFQNSRIPLFILRELDYVHDFRCDCFAQMLCPLSVMLENVVTLLEDFAADRSGNG